MAKQWLGMNWIRQEKRLAIYLRDGMACCYCGHSQEDGAQLTLDHLRPRSKGGSNHESNLVTCCHRCNSSRGNRTVRAFCRAVADYIDGSAKPEAIEKYVRNQVRVSLRPFLAESKTVRARRNQTL
jgi:5-methylcytosine-specific restriction endonuclease McrA